ncbi:MAG: alpha-ketoacid dehydrogenase subunit beta [Candidatus Tectomicrobia bacterium]|nr:alpha-ketoacid dehydrogenase subunit beta [Candidatus Tectomicrobia bacterium]
MRELTYREALREALREEMARDENVFLLGEDIAEFGGSYKVTQGLLQEFGRERVRNTPISEQAIVGAALGAALVGMRPVAELMYIDFSTVAMDQIVNQAAKVRYMFGGKAKTALVIRTQGGAGRSSGAQHAQSLEAWFVHVPGLKVVMPSTPYDAKGLLKAAIRDEDPVIFIEHKLLYGEKGPVPEEEYVIPLGKADVKREGRDATLVATSRMVQRSLQAAEVLSKEGVEVEVVDPRTLFPLDVETLFASVRKTNRLVIVHEAVRRCGWGAEVAARVAEEAMDYLDAPIRRVAALETPVPFAPNLEDYVIPNVERIVGGVRALWQ